MDASPIVGNELLAYLFCQVRWKVNQYVGVGWVCRKGKPEDNRAVHGDIRSFRDQLRLEF